MPSWWASVLRNAADVLCRHQGFIKDVRFALEVDGSPRPVPGQIYKRYYEEGNYSPHEQFAAGDVIGVSCLVPDTIRDDDFWRLMNIAGQYYGMSPYRPGEYGFFKVDSQFSHTNQEEGQNDNQEKPNDHH